MKKSFMTRALAMGLSFAMAFSLSAATNVTTASAAAKKASVTSFMKASSKTVTEGKSVTTYMKSSVAKKYRIKSHTESSVAKKYISVKMTDSRKGLKITAKEGALAAAKLEKKGVNVKINFAPAKSAAAVKKAAATKYVNLKVVVKAAVKPVENLTITAKATHANEIVATFNKAVGSDAKVTLKKGTADVANTAKIAEDGKSATITLTGKLTDGTYTVTVVAGDETATADVVAENEKLSSFKLGTTLKETISSYKSVSNTATAILSYQALNQYGDKINYTADDKAIVSSIGRVQNVKPCKTSQSGTFEVTEIPAMYAIKGQQFQISIVDTVNYTGVMANETVVYGAAATAKEFTLVGAYNTAKGAFKDIADGDKVTDYVLLFSAKDQYGDDMDAKAVATEASNTSIQVTIAGGLTNIKASDDYKNMEKNQKEVSDANYFAVPLTPVSNDADKKTANAGTYRVNIVNSTQGSVFDQEYTIVDGVIISSVQITASDVLYAKQDNAMDYVVTDSQGNTLKDYATLKNITIDSTKTGDKFTWKKNTDGTAKLVYNPAAVAHDTLRKYKGSEVRGCTIKANKEVSGKLYVTSKTFTVYEERQPVTVTGVKSDATRVSTGARQLSFDTKKLIILDQYSNPFTEAEIKSDAHNTLTNVYVSTAAVRPSDSNIIVTGGSTEYVSGATVTPANIVATLKISGLADNVTDSAIKLQFFVSSAAAKLINSNKPDEGAEVAFTYGNTNKVNGLTVASVNGGCPLYVDGVTNSGYLLPGENEWASAEEYYDYNGGWPQYYTTAGRVVVKGNIGGKTGVVPTSQWQFVGAEADGSLAFKGVKAYDLAGEVITETREFSIVVDTADGPQTITGKVDVSNAPRVGTTISANDNGNGSVPTTVSAGSDYAVTAGAVRSLFTTKTQYNEVVSGAQAACELISYTVNDLVVSGAGVTINGTPVATGKSVSVDYVKTSMPGTNNASFWLDSTGISVSGTPTSLIAKVHVTAQASKDSAKTAEKDITVEFKLNY